jgi:glutamine amidotransferase
MNRVAVIDSGLCNIDSIRRALEEVGTSPYVVAKGVELGQPDRIVLPGVGAFPEAMASLAARELDRALTDEVMGTGIPVLGICLGMQLLATHGSENGGAAGLGWIDGDVVRLEPSSPEERIPHMGWNEVDPVGDGSLFAGIAPRTDFYFVHSYHFAARSDEDVEATTPYCGGFTSSVRHDTIFGVQFHPEKSQRAGFQVLRNFVAV